MVKITNLLVSTVARIQQFISWLPATLYSLYAIIWVLPTRIQFSVD